MTRFGRSVLIGALAFAVAGVAFGYAEVVMLCGFVLVLVSSGWLLTARRPALSAERELRPTHVTRTYPASGTLRVMNIGSRTARGVVGIERVGSASVALDVPRLAPGEVTHIDYPVPTQRRGVVIVGPASFVNRDLWGMWERVRPVPGRSELFVRPLTHTVHAPGRGVQRALDGGETTRALEGSSTFHTLREYVAGDDRRRIHWRSSARTGVLMVRQHIDLSRPEVLIAVDLGSEAGDDFEATVELVASVGAAALRERSPVRLVTSLGTDELFASPEREAALLDALTVVEATGEATDPTWLPTVAAQHSGSAAIVVSTEQQDAVVASATFLTSRYSTVVVARVVPTPFTVLTRGVTVIGATDGPDLAVVWNARVER